MILNMLATLFMAFMFVDLYKEYKQICKETPCERELNVTAYIVGMIWWGLTVYCIWR